MDSSLYLYLLMPFISGVVGWATNVIALKMTFYPIEFLGPKLWQPEGQPFGLFGWQGIIPAKAAQMAAKQAVGASSGDPRRPGRARTPRTGRRSPVAPLPAAAAPQGAVPPAPGEPARNS